MKLLIDPKSVRKRQAGTLLSICRHLLEEMPLNNFQHSAAQSCFIWNFYSLTDGLSDSRGWRNNGKGLSANERHMLKLLGYLSRLRPSLLSEQMPEDWQDLRHFMQAHAHLLPAAAGGFFQGS